METSIKVTKLENRTCKNGSVITLSGIKDLLQSKELIGKKKDELPCIIVSGVFDSREEHLEYSGLIHVDVDGIGFERAKDILDKLKYDPYALFAFISPSNTGIKIFATTRKDNGGRYVNIQRAFASYIVEMYGLDWQYIDEKLVKNVKGLCYVPYRGEDMYIFKELDEVIEFNVYDDNQVNINNMKSTTNGILKASHQLLRKIEDKITAHKYIKGSRNQYVNDFVTACYCYGINKADVIDYIFSGDLSDIVPEQDHNASEIMSVIDSIYSKVVLNNGKRFGQDKFIVEESESKHKDSPLLRRLDLLFRLAPNLRVVKLKTGIYDNPYIFELGLLEDGVVRIVSFEEVIIHLNERYKESDEQENLDFQILVKQLNEKMLYANLPIIEIDINTRSIYFSNGYVLENGEIKKYNKENSEVVLSTKMKRFNYIPNLPGESEFERFCRLALGEDQMELVRLAIGYLVARPAPNSKYSVAVLLLDKEAVENNVEAEGGTGKSLFADVIRFVVGGIMLDMRSSDLNNRFIYSEYNLGDGLIIYDDIKRSFKLEDLYHVITNGFKKENKGKDAIKIDGSIGYKAIVTANYKISINGNSDMRRRIDLLFTDYFKHNPIFKEFKHTFISDWDDREMSLFFDFIARCCREFNEKGYEYMINLNNTLRANQYRKMKNIPFVTEYINNKIGYIYDVLATMKILESSEIYEDYCEWMQVRGYSRSIEPKQVVNRKLIKDLQDRFGVTLKTCLKRSGSSIVRGLTYSSIADLEKLHAAKNMLSEDDETVEVIIENGKRIDVSTDQSSNDNGTIAQSDEITKEGIS